jgi:hypothetical protein
MKAMSGFLWLARRFNGAAHHSFASAKPQPEFAPARRSFAWRSQGGREAGRRAVKPLVEFRQVLSSGVKFCQAMSSFVKDSLGRFVRFQRLSTRNLTNAPLCEFLRRRVGFA